MNYKKCYLYGLKSKKKLLELLHIDRKIYCKSFFINNKIFPYVETNEDKSRLVEAPSEDLKIIQTRILKALQAIDLPEYVFSGIRNKSFIDNAKQHSNKTYVFKIDISKFFPNISRDRVYKFFVNKLKTSPDVSNILTNFSTINLNLKNQKSSNMIKVNNFIKDSLINERNHLITGSPISCIMSFLANVDMFEEIYNYATKYKITMTVYVDDIIFSSNNKIPYFFRNNILAILLRNNYKVSKNKCRWCNKAVAKEITGIILDKTGKPQITNRLMLKSHNYLKEIKEFNFTHLKNLQGCLNVTKSINGKYETLERKLRTIKK